MKKRWQVKLSGKIELVLFVYAVLLVAFAVLVGRKMLGGVPDNARLHLDDLIFFIPVAIIVGLFIIIFARKKKVPTSIEVDDSYLKISFLGRKHEGVNLNFEDISYFKIKKSLFTIMIINEKSIASRGHTNHFEVFNIFALPISTSWTKRHLEQIVEQLDKAGIEYHEPFNEKNLVDYIFGS